MAKQYALTAENRDRAGKGVARALRRELRIPAVIYGDSKEPVMISILLKDIHQEYMKGGMYTHLCNLDVAGQKQLCLARDIQTHPVTDRIEHADFLRVTPKTKIAVEIPVHFVGQETSPGMKAGGVLNIVSHELELLCSATDIPEFIEVDLSSVEIGDSIRMDKVKLPKGTVPTDNDPEHVVATIVAPKNAKADEEADAAVAAASAAASAAAAAPTGGIAAAPVKKEDKK